MINLHMSQLLLRDEIYPESTPTFLRYIISFKLHIRSMGQILIFYSHFIGEKLEAQGI